MAHWDHRPEENWKRFRFNQPYAKGLKRLKDEVLSKTDFDPATLWQWGTMQAMALIQILKDAEEQLGADGQKLIFDALRKTGKDVGKQILAGTEWPKGMTEAEFVSYYATVVNRIAYASLEEPKIDSNDQVSFDIVWCPHQDHYEAFDCRVQRYFVQGMLEAATDFAGALGFDVRFDSTIPSGAPTCHFTLWRGAEEEKAGWQQFTQMIEAKALARAQRRKNEK